MTCLYSVFLYYFLYFTLISCHHHHHHSVSDYNAVENEGFENSTQSPTEANILKVKIRLYYETLCPASVDFFIEQLRPTVEKLGQHLDVHLVPYGHAKTRALNWQYRFKCQHGPEECYGNKLHACVIDVMQNSTKSVLLTSCLMQYTQFVAGYGYDFAAALAWCGYKLQYSYEGIGQCVLGRRGNVLLKRHGEDTHALKPRYVPFVMINESTEDQDRATDNLMSVICQKLDNVPLACRDL